MRARYSDKNKINVITLGCSKNTYDSEVLMGQLKANNKNITPNVIKISAKLKAGQ